MCMFLPRSDTDLGCCARLPLGVPSEPISALVFFWFEVQTQQRTIARRSLLDKFNAGC